LLNNNQIRLRYSGFIVFTTQLLGVVTGLIFTLLLTRSMTVAEFGIWTNIFDYTPYFIVVGGVLPFWVLRFTARGKEGAAKTATISQLFIAVVATLIYLPAIYFISNAIGTTQYLLIYFIAGFYVLTYYLITVFEDILQATKPHVTGYGFIIQEIVKVAVALLVILVFKQVFFGAILALVIAPTIQSFYYTYVLRGFFKEKVNWNYLKQWLKGAPALLYNAVGVQLLSLAFILLFIFGGSEARAYYQAALSFTTIVGYASSLAVSLYPKLLANSCSEKEVGLSFRTVMMLAIPLATLTMVMAVSFLTVLNPSAAPGQSFGVAWPVLIALTVDTLVVLINNFYSSCLMGVEAFDAEGQISFRQLVRSKIFKVFSIPYLQAAFTIPIAYLVLTQLAVDGPVETAVAFVGILIAVHAATFTGLYVFMRNHIHIPVAWESVAKYILAALLMGVVLYLLPTTTTLMLTIAKTIGGFSLYVGLLLLIDAQARELVGLIWQEIVFTIKQLTHKTNTSGENTSVQSEN
jgi:O-antigen/teichoic acid export membrane protein